MLRRRKVFVVVQLALISLLCSKCYAAWKDRSPHRILFVTVDGDVRLEVLDWGGSGRPVVLLAGGGDTAHVFDDFAPKLRARNHVYGITRRGFGASGFSATDDPADRLGNDVSEVIDSLRLKKPILIGHSIAGAELSWLANNYPDRIEGVIYLDAAYSYAFDDGQGSSIQDMMQLHAPEPPPPNGADLSSFLALRKYYERIDGFQFPEAELRQQRETSPDGRVGKRRDFPGGRMLMSLITSRKKYTQCPVNSLVIFANPHSLGNWIENAGPSVRTDARIYSIALTALTDKQEKAVENGIPTVHVITVPGANHYVYLSNEREVLRATRGFIDGLH